MTDVLCIAVLATSISHCCSMEGLDSLLINTELTASSFHLTEWSFPGWLWRTQKFTLSPQMLSFSPQMLWSSSLSRKRSGMISHQFPSVNTSWLRLMGRPLDGPSLLISLLKFLKKAILYSLICLTSRYLETSSAVLWATWYVRMMRHSWSLRQLYKNPS